MKYFILSILLLAAACNNKKTDTALEGIYTASYEHEFGRSDDTIILRKTNTVNGVYQITRHTGLIKKLDGKEFSKELKSETWNLDYDDSKQTFTELREGKILVWDSNRLTLQLGNRSYKKISDL